LAFYIFLTKVIKILTTYLVNIIHKIL